MSYLLPIFLFSALSLPAAADVELAATEVSAESSVVPPTLEEHQPTPPDEEAKANIITPADGAILKAMDRNKLKYEITGSQGYHGQLYIDGKKSEFLTKPVGTENITELPAGNYELCVQALNKSHLEVGIRDCVKVSVQ